MWGQVWKPQQSSELKPTQQDCTTHVQVKVHQDVLESLKQNKNLTDMTRGKRKRKNIYKNNNNIFFSSLIKQQAVLSCLFVYGFCVLHFLLRIEDYHHSTHLRDGWFYSGFLMSGFLNAIVRKKPSRTKTWEKVGDHVWVLFSKAF